eukprot:gene10056-10930_t
MFRRLVKTSAANRVFGKRFMGGGHHHAPPQGGLDGVVRKYLPEDQHVVLGIAGFYVSLYLLSKLIFGGKKKDEQTVAAVVKTADGEIPAVDSAEFGDWLSADGNLEKLFS